MPAGTKLNVRLTQAIEVDASQAGMKFKALVDDPVMIGGAIVIPRGAYGDGPGRQRSAVRQDEGQRQDLVEAQLDWLRRHGLRGRERLRRDPRAKARARKRRERSAGGAGLGAIVGGIAGGGSGAAIGAAVGGATGAAVAAGGEEHLKLPAETRLQFQLSAAVAIRLDVRVARDLCRSGRRLRGPGGLLLCNPVLAFSSRNRTARAVALRTPRSPTGVA